MVVQWNGECGPMCRPRGGVEQKSYVFRRGKGTLCTSLSYCVRLLGLRNGNVEGLQLLAQKDETWRRLVDDLRGLTL